MGQPAVIRGRNRPDNKQKSMDSNTHNFGFAVPPDDVLMTLEIYSPKKHDSTFAPKIEIETGKFSIVLVNGSLSDAEWVLKRLDSLIARALKNN